ncbi:VOC family protein (plasmid) [Salipiger sp. H15]|uniref:VOC family protein n=1 Tax=Alloyangia sp. H15 TaxID=3029062 RepID=A0AAU8AQW5_9RHOB
MPIFKQLHHVCILVHDLEATQRFYESVGIGPWYDYPKTGTYRDFEVPNEAASKAMRYMCCDLDNVQIQLCDPGRLDSPQKRHLDAHGEGLYQLGFEVPDLSAAETEGRALGLGVVARGRKTDESGFCYFDTKARAGVVLEIRRTPEDQKKTA